MLSRIRKRLYKKALLTSWIFGVIGVGMVLLLENGAAQPLTVSSNVGEGFAVVELFTSEGCSSCPPADRNLGKIVKSARESQQAIYALGFHVDYWNGLGWEDPFSNPFYSFRQRQYSRAFQNGSIYTPQMIVNGRYEFGGYREDLSQRYINAAVKESAVTGIKLQVSRVDDKLLVQYSLGGVYKGYWLNFALVERHLKSDVKRGENVGRQLNHENVVRQFKTIALTSPFGEMDVAIGDEINLKESSLVAYVQIPETMVITGAVELVFNDD